MLVAQNHNKALLDEETRKRMRVERLNKVRLGHQADISSLTKFDDPNLTDLEKKK